MVYSGNQDTYRSAWCQTCLGCPAPGTRPCPASALPGQHSLCQAAASALQRQLLSRLSDRWRVQNLRGSHGDLRTEQPAAWHGMPVYLDMLPTDRAQELKGQACREATQTSLSAIGPMHVQACQLSAWGGTWLELVMIWPVQGAVLDGVMGHPQNGPLWDRQLACQADVTAADSQLPNADRRVPAHDVRAA